MNIGSLLKKVGGGIIKQVFPAAGMVIDVVNEFLPDNKKLSEDSTGDQVKAAVDALPPEQKSAILSKKLDVEITEIKEWSNVISSLAAADATGNSTRPWIAKLMASAVFITIIGYVIGFVYAIWSRDNEVLESVSKSWGVMLAVLATPTALLRAYFGLRTEEKKARYATSQGQQHISGMVGMVGKWLDKRNN